MTRQLDHSPAHIMARWLRSLGLGSDPTLTTLLDWPVYVDETVDTPDSLIIVSNTTGITGNRTAPDSERDESDGFQILVRSIRPDLGYVKSNEIAIALDQSTTNIRIDIDSSSYWISMVERMGNVLSLGREQESRRYLHAVNAVVKLDMI